MCGLYLNEAVFKSHASLLWPPCIADADIIFSSCGFFFLLFFLTYSQPSQIRCLSYFHTWCCLSANLECKSEMCCMWLTENTGRKKIAKNLPSAHHRTNTLGCIFATKPCIDNRKKLVKQQYLLHMSPQYGELLSTNGWDQFRSLRHPSKFQRVSHLGFVTAETSFAGGEPNFARCLAICWAGTLYIDFREFFPDGILLVQNSLCVQVLRAPILAALLYGTRVVGVSQSLQRGTRNGIRELLQTAPPIFGWAAITLGIGHILVLTIFHNKLFYSSYFTTKSLLLS